MASASSSAGKNPLQCGRPWFDSWVGKIRWRREQLPIPVFWGFPGGSAGKESSYNAGDVGSTPGGGEGHPLQYSGLENPTDCIVCGVAKNQTWLSHFHFTLLTMGSSLLLDLAPKSPILRAHFSLHFLKTEPKARFYVHTTSEVTSEAEMKDQGRWSGKAGIVYTRGQYLLVTRTFCSAYKMPPQISC